jgi:hypothetical protein
MATHNELKGQRSTNVIAAKMSPVFGDLFGDLFIECRQLRQFGHVQIPKFHRHRQILKDLGDGRHAHAQ